MIYSLQIKPHQVRTLLVVSVHFKGPDTSILRLATSVNSFLFVHKEPLVSLEQEGLVVPAAFSSVQL
ncbi:unnamed protein product [Timema podura]|uniref:Uncharacterized protein n=1 Tax=Timema podura TaxID=61482 RepID=A0ABN7PCZ8_TIMPD|nr:unnamed protein product [Timema podura]